MTLNWNPPTENTDGTSLDDLDGYIIYYGTSPQTMETEIPLSNPGLSSYTVEDLPADDYYFVITAINSKAVESDQSNMVEATVKQN